MDRQELREILTEFAALGLSRKRIFRAVGQAARANGELPLESALGAQLYEQALEAENGVE